MMRSDIRHFKGSNVGGRKEGRNESLKTVYCTIPVADRKRLKIYNPVHKSSTKMPRHAPTLFLIAIWVLCGRWYITGGFCPSINHWRARRATRCRSRPRLWLSVWLWVPLGRCPLNRGWPSVSRCGWAGLISLWRRWWTGASWSRLVPTLCWRSPKINVGHLLTVVRSGQGAIVSRRWLLAVAGLCSGIVVLRGFGGIRIGIGVTVSIIVVLSSSAGPSTGWWLVSTARIAVCATAAIWSITATVIITTSIILISAIAWSCRCTGSSLDLLLWSFIKAMIT